MNDRPPPPVIDNAPPTLSDLFSRRNALYTRETGALLTISARWAQDPEAKPAVQIDWAIDYNGPRRPFTILTPGDGYGQVTAHFWYLRPDGTVATFTEGMERGIGSGPIPLSQRHEFSVSDGGKPVTGRLEKPGRNLMPRMGREPRPGDPQLWVQLECVRTNRGDWYDVVADPMTGRPNKILVWTVDAWTGHLWSSVVAIAAN